MKLDDAFVVFLSLCDQSFYLTFKVDSNYARGDRFDMGDDFLMLRMQLVALQGIKVVKTGNQAKIVGPLRVDDVCAETELANLFDLLWKRAHPPGQAAENQ